MTANQTIDGVPRDRIEDAARAAQIAGYTGLAEELRALLDAPACKTCGDAGWVPEPFSIRENMLECPDCKPAAQPQGEPVAIHSNALKLLKRVHTNLVAYKGSAVELNLKTPISDAVLLDVEEFIAAQPAPVAVNKIGTHHVLGAIHNVEGFPGVTGFQIKTLTDLLNSVITDK